MTFDSLVIITIPITISTTSLFLTFYATRGRVREEELSIYKIQTSEHIALLQNKVNIMQTQLEACQRENEECKRQIVSLKDENLQLMRKIFRQG